MELTSDECKIKKWKATFWVVQNPNKFGYMKQDSSVG